MTASRLFWTGKSAPLRSAALVHAHARAFLERATDGSGPSAVVIDQPAGIADRVWSDVAFAALLAERLVVRPGVGRDRFVATVRYDVGLRDPRDGASLGDDARGTLTLHLDERRRNQMQLELAFPAGHMSDPMVRVVDAAEELAGFTQRRSGWRRERPDAPSERLHVTRGDWCMQDPPPADPVLEPILAQIRAAPDDDGPRQIYGDVLLARDDPRGAFVMAQLELARLPGGSPRWHHVRKLQDKLLAEHGYWLRLPAGIRGTFRRGFVDELAMSWLPLSSATLQVKRECPLVRKLAVERRISESWIYLIEELGMTLGFTAFAVEPGPGMVTRLAGSALAPTVRELELRCYEPTIVPELLALLGDPRSLPALDSLALVGPPLPFDTCLDLARTSQARGLQRFTAWSPDWTPAQQAAVTGSRR